MCCPKAPAHPAPAGTARTVSIYASPNPAHGGQPVAVFGRLIGGRVCGQPVTLWQRPVGASRYRKMTDLVTDRTGRYRYVFAPDAIDTNGQWFASVGAVHSATLSEHVQATVTLTSSATFAIAGDRETFTGQVDPAQAGRRIFLERRVRGRWLLVAQPRPDRSGAFSTVRLFGQAGTQQWRAEVPTTPRNLGSISPVVGIRVAPASGIHKIRHIVVIMQENRSFDSYFGTFPAADGIPPGVCVPDPVNGGCVAPYHDSSDQNNGGPHGVSNATADIDGGAMDGVVNQAEKGIGCTTTNPDCSPCTEQFTGQLQASRCVDVMAITTRARSRTIGPTHGTSCFKITCSSPTPHGACRPTYIWSPSGRRGVRGRWIRSRAVARRKRPTPTGLRAPAPRSPGRRTKPSITRGPI